MNKTVGIIGAGLMGRLVALQLAQRGAEVILIDKDDREGRASAAYAAAGMLAPYSESLLCEANIVQMGVTSLRLWPELLATLDDYYYFQQAGTLLVSHEQDQGDFARFQQHINRHYPESAQFLTREDIAHYEPELARKFSQAIYLPEEGQIGNRKLLVALQVQLEKLNVSWQENTEVFSLGRENNGRYKILANQHSKQRSFDVDLVVDCRGAGARKPLSASNESMLPIDSLRGVRGELFQLFAPDVHITRPVRLMHPRYQLYIVPKTKGFYVVGATEIESEDTSSMTVRSALELLSAAYSVHPGFAEANIRQHLSQLRPAFADNQPKIVHQDYYIQINGLFRHGYLIAPVALAQTVALCEQLIAMPNGKVESHHLAQLPYQSLLPVKTAYENLY
ncbi:glycine oxidase ThiO [Thalassotalea fusca]